MHEEGEGGGGGGACLWDAPVCQLHHYNSRSRPSPFTVYVRVLIVRGRPTSHAQLKRARKR